MHKAGRSSNTVAKVYRLFRTIMSTAVDDGLLRSNPVSIKGAAAEEHHARPVPTFEEVARLADAIEPRFSALVWLAATSGLRYSELTALCRSHIDLKRSTVRVERALAFERGVGAAFGPPKTPAAHRSVVIPAGTIDILGAHLDEYVASDPHALVFTSVKGSPLLYRYFAPYWTRAKAAAGVSEAVHFHDLRHLASTTAASSRRVGQRAHGSHGARHERRLAALPRGLSATRRRDRRGDGGADRHHASPSGPERRTSAQHFGSPVVEPLSDLIWVEPDELADLEEGDPSLRDQTTHEALPDVEHHCDSRDVVQLPTRRFAWIEPALNHQSLPTSCLEGHFDCTD